MFLSNWLIFKIVLAAVTGLVDYPLAADVLLVYDGVNKLYLSGNSLDYVSNIVLYKGETSYEIGKTINVGKEQKIVASDRQASDQFGYSVSISGDYAIFGALRKDTYTGAAYIYKRNASGVWGDEQKIVASDRQTGDEFGWSVSLSGDYAIVGALNEDTGGSNAGAVYIYKRNATTGVWGDEQRIQASDKQQSDQFGISVSISGDYAIVGALNEDATGDVNNNAGAAYIYKRNTSTGVWGDEQKIVASDRQTGDVFGWSVSLSGDYAIVGARYEDGTGDVNNNTGAAYIYKRNETTGVWGDEQKITASDIQANDQFGYSVSISGDYAIVGAWFEDVTGDDNRGAAYIYKRNETTGVWGDEQKITASDKQLNDEFGKSVSLSGDYAIVGAWLEDPGGTADAGSAYIFKREGTTWSQITKLFASDKASSTSAQFGQSVAIDGGYAIVGANYEDTGGTNAGAAYIYPFDQAENYYITQPGTYRADLQICGIDYKTNEVEVTGTPSDIEVFTEPETDFTASEAVLSSTSSISYHQGGMSDNGEYYYYGQQVYKKDMGSFTYTAYGSALSSTIFNGSQSSISHDGNYIVSYYTNSTYQLHIIKNNGSTFVNHQTIASPNSSARSDSQPQFIPGPLKHFVWVEKVNNTNNIVFHFYKYNSGTDTWSLGFSVTNPTDLSVGVRVYGRGGMSFSKDGNYLAISTGTGGTTQTGVAVLKVDWVNETCVKKYENTSVGYWACFLSRDAKYFYYSTGTSTTAGKMLYSANGDWESTPTDVTSSFTNIGNLGDHSSVLSDRYIFSEKGGSAIYIFKWQDLISPTLTFDNYNKLSLTNTPTYVSSKLTYGSNVYDIGTLTSDITIEKQGKYASLTFDTSSNVAYFSNVTVDTVLDAPGTRAFFHGNFVDTFSDGDVTTAASNGRFYADMLETTTAFGTVSVTSSTSTSTTYQLVVPTELTGTNVLIVGGGGGGGSGQDSVHYPSGGGGGEVKNLTNQTISAGTYTIVVGKGGTNASGTNSSALGTTANGGGDGNVGSGGTSGSGNGPGANDEGGQYNVGGGGGDAASGLGRKGGDGSNVSWLDGSLYGEQINGQAYFGGGAGSGNGGAHGKGRGLGTGGGAYSNTQLADSGMVAIYSSVGLGVKYIGFDRYNKLSLLGITNPTSKLHALPTGAESTTTYDIGTATNIYIESAGTYTAEIKGLDSFALSSNVVSVVDTTIIEFAFHYEAFNSSYYSGKYSSTSDAAAAGVVYSDTATSTTYSWGTLNSIDTSTSVQTGYSITLSTELTGTNVLIVGGGGGGGSGQDSVHWPSGGGGGEVKNLTNQTISAGTYTIVVGKGGTNASGTNSSALGTTANGGGDGNVGSGGTSGSGNGPGANDEGGQYNVGGGGGDAASGLGRKGGDGSNVSWLDGSLYGEQINGQAYFGGGAGSGNGGAHGKGNGLPGTGGGSFSNTQLADSGIVVIRSGPASELPSLTFDGYNKYTFTGADTDSTYKLKYESNTYDLGTISNVYIAYPGTYSAEIKGATNFALSSNVATIQALPTRLQGSDISTMGTTNYTRYGVPSSQSIDVEDFLFNSSSNINPCIDFIHLTNSQNTFVFDLESVKTIKKIRIYAGNTTPNWASRNTGSVVKLYNGSTLVYTSPSLTFSRSSPETYYGPYEEGKDYNTLLFTSGYTNIDKITVETPSTSAALGRVEVNDFTDTPSLNFDTYNKLTLSGLESGSTLTTLNYGSNTYDIGTVSNVYISETGTYEAESNDTNTFALMSTVVGAIQTHPDAAYANYRSIGAISAASTSLHNENITTTYSVTMWAKKINGNFFFRTANSDSSTNPTNTHGILRWDGSKISHVTWTSNNGLVITYNTTLDETSKDEWHFYGFEFEGTTTKLHLDGAAPITGTTGLNGQTHNRIRFDDPTVFSTGGARLAEFAVYNRALTDAEFVSIYNNGKPNGPDNVSSGRVSWFKCLSGAMATNSGSGGDFDTTITEDVDVPSSWKYTPPSLTHDGYKLVVKNITPTSTTLKYFSNTYEIGTATNIYVENTGAYTAEIGSATDFALLSNTVSGTIKTIEPGFASRYQGSMALTYDGKLYAWGMNDDGEAGVGTSSDITVPTLCTGITQGTVAKLLSSSDLTDNSRGEVSYVKTIDGKIYATGKGDNFVIPGTTSDLTSFTDVTSYFGDQSLTANNVTMMSFTDRSGAALTETGNVWTWGTHDSTNKALGQTSASSSSTPKQINFSSVTGTITKITCGNVHNLALDSSGDVWFWGKNGFSTAWPSSVTDEPQKVVDGKNIIGLASSYGTMYAWDATGKMWNAGDNSDGQIGDGTITSAGKTLTEVTYFSSNGITINKVYAGGEFVFADTSDGYYYWGAGTHGVFGNGSTGNITSPAKWTNVSNIKKFMASTQHTTAITEDGKYYAWGRDYHGGRGDSDSSSDISYPKHIDTLPNILAPSFEFDGYDKFSIDDNVFLPPDSFPNIISITYNNLFGIGGGNYSYRIGALTPTSKFYENYSGSTAEPTNYGIEFRHESDGTTKLYVNSDNNNANPSTVKTNDTTTSADNVVITSNTTEVILETTAGSSYYATFNVTSDMIFNNRLTATSTIKKDGVAYDVGKASIVTVQDPGTYDAQLSQGSVFALKSETIPATSTTGLYTWAFHHGNFDNAYGDGDILTARDNGRFYADTPAYTGDIGTITAYDQISTTYIYKFYCTVLPGPATGNTTTSEDTNFILTEISSTTVTLTDNMFAIASGQFVAGGLSSDLFDGDTTETGGIYQLARNTITNGLEVGKHMFTITTSVELLQLSISTHRPGYYPGIKIVLNDTHILVDETSNQGTSGTPSPYTKSYTFSSNYSNSNYSSIDKTTYTFTPASTLTANVLMVAGGGGGGGRYHAGGGGAGGLVYTAGTSLANGATKTIVVGNGDSGGNATGSPYDNGFNGKNTTFTGLDNAVGGGGGGANYTAANSGGSGGGGGASQSSGNPNAGGSGTANQGNVGGVGIYAGDSNRSGGGGGGAGGVGIPGVSGSVSGEGGIGKFFGTGSSFTNFGDEYGEGGYFAGGGGGGVYHSGRPQGIPGRGGGGYGATEYGYMGVGGSQHALPHTGGGGGGSGMGETTDQHPGYASTGDGGVTGHGGRGGSGIVLVQTNVAPPNGGLTAPIQPGNPRRRSLPPAVSLMGSEVNRFYIIDSASMPTYKLPTHWYVDPIGNNSDAVQDTQGAHYNLKRADGGTSIVWYQTSYGYFAEYGKKMAQSADALFMPVVQQRYNVLLSLGDSTVANRIELEMAADGTAKLYRNNGANLIIAGTIICFEAGKWHHIALTVDSGGNAVGYVNGYPVVSGTYTSVGAVGSRNQNVYLRCGVGTVTFQKFITYEISTYNFHMSPKQVLQRATEVGLGPKLEYDGLNTLNVVNAEPGSEITIYKKDEVDTTNLYIVACNSSSYTLSNAATYYAQIKGTDTFTITKSIDVAGTFPLYQYPPLGGTISSSTASVNPNDFSTWTISGAPYGNGQYRAASSTTSVSGNTPYNAFTNNIYYGFSSTTSTTGTLVFDFPEVKTIRKYVLYPIDTAATTTSVPGSNTDPTLSLNNDNTNRPKSWTLEAGQNGIDWVVLDTVVNQPPSIYGDVHTISSPGSYLYYRINVSENNGGTGLKIGEFQLWGDLT